MVVVEKCLSILVDDDSTLSDITSYPHDLTATFLGILKLDESNGAQVYVSYCCFQNTSAKLHLVESIILLAVYGWPKYEQSGILNNAHKAMLKPTDRIEHPQKQMKNVTFCCASANRGHHFRCNAFHATFNRLSLGTVALPALTL